MKPEKTLQEMKELVWNERNQMNVRNELGKLGIKADELCLGEQGLSGSRATAVKSACRRAANALFAEWEKSSNKPDRGQTLRDALDTIAAHIEVINLQTELDAEAANAFGYAPSGDGVTIRDTNGQRIGVQLTADDLRDPRKIAAKLPRAQVDSSMLSAGDDGMTLGGFLRGVAGMKTSQAVHAALQEGVGSSGGYLVPSVILPGILNAMVPASSLLNAGAGIVMLDQNAAKSFTIAATDTIPTAAWRSENGTVTESDPAFRAVTVTPQSLAFIIRVSRELLQDAPGLEQALLTAIAQSFAVEMDRAGLLGTGTAPEIKGLANVSGINTVAFGGANGGPVANYSPFVAARGAILGANAPEPTACITSVRDDTSLAGLVDTLGQPMRKPDALANWRFLPTSQIPVNKTVGTSTDCSMAFVGDFRSVNFYLRESVNVQLLREAYATTGQVGFLAHARLDIAASYPKALAMVTGLRPAV